jgi:dTDP-4-amino-4,6-dideoxygalactose transaminase
MTATFPAWPCFSDEEADAVRDVILSNRVNYWTGWLCRDFEREFASWSGASQAIALANGTVALDLALNALGIGAGDEVIVTPRTFIASISSVVNAGATPVFADVDADSGNISPETIAAVMTEKTKAVVPVHLAGWPCDMQGILALTAPRGIYVIEDCAQAHGAKIGEQMVGSFGDVGAWSFCQDKIMTTGGEGGMVTVNNPDLWSKMWSFKDHGKSFDAVYHRDHPPGFRWLHESFGTNWRMMEVQAAIGQIQLRRMADWTAQRTAAAKAIIAMLQGFEDAVRVPGPDAGFTHAYYRLYAYVRQDGLKDGWNRDRIITEIQKTGAPVMQGTCSEVYLEKAFDGTGWRPAQRLPNARALGETSLCFLLNPNLNADDMARYCGAVSGVLQDAAR